MIWCEMGWFIEPNLAESEGKALCLVFAPDFQVFPEVHVCGDGLAQFHIFGLGEIHGEGFPRREKQRGCKHGAINGSRKDISSTLDENQ